MRIVLITQKEPFYLAENISYLLKKLPKESKIVAAVIANPSPFGNKESFYRKAIKTLNIFGLKFFIFYRFWLSTSKNFTSRSFSIW